MDIAAFPPPPDGVCSDLNAAELEALQANGRSSTLSPRLLWILVQHCAVWRVPAHHILATQGSVPDVWFGVAAGAVRLSSSSPEGRDTTIDLLEPGQWFGDVPLLSGFPVPYGASTWAPSTLLVMRRSTLRQLLATYADLGPALLRLNWERSARLMECMVDQSEPVLELRVRRLLTSLAARFGAKRRDATRISLPMTQTQFGQLVGCSRQRVNAVVNRLERQGEIRRSRQDIDIVHRCTRTATP